MLGTTGLTMDSVRSPLRQREPPRLRTDGTIATIAIVRRRIRTPAEIRTGTTKAARRCRIGPRSNRDLRSARRRNARTRHLIGRLPRRCITAKGFNTNEGSLGQPEIGRPICSSTNSVLEFLRKMRQGDRSRAREIHQLWHGSGVRPTCPSATILGTTDAPHSD